MKQKARNAAADLVALGLAVRQGENLVPTKSLLEASKVPDIGIHQVVRKQALDSAFLREFQRLVREYPGYPSAEIGTKLGGRLGLAWSATSAHRYAGAGRGWYRFFATESPRLL